MSRLLVRARYKVLPVRVLLLTARQSDSDIVQSFDPGAGDYLAKPFRTAELVSRLKRLLPKEDVMTRILFLSLWAALVGVVVTGSLLPAASPLMADIGRLRINDKAEHFCAYLALSFCCRLSDSAIGAAACE